MLLLLARPGGTLQAVQVLSPADDSADAPDEIEARLTAYRMQRLDGFRELDRLKHGMGSLQRISYTPEGVAVRIAVVGAGAIGAYWGAALQRGGAEVHLIARNAHLQAMRRTAFGCSVTAATSWRTRTPPTTRRDRAG